MSVTLTDERIKFLEFIEVIHGLPEAHHVSCAQVFLKSLDGPALRAAVEAQINAHFAKISLAHVKPKVVVLVHGIRTQGDWFKIVKSELRNFEPFKVEECKYEYFDLFNFLCPILTRHFPKKKTLRNLHSIIADNGDADYYLISHSNGTYVMSHILAESPHIQFKGIIFCGSIVNENFRWDTLKSFPRDMFINDIGTKDILPVLAKISTIGYGASGRFGFNHHGVMNRHHNLGHSGFFTSEFIARYWTPFLVHGEKVESPWDLEKPAEKAWLQWVGSKPYLLWYISIIIAAGLYFAG